jgi:hypothetical protein
VTKLLYGARHFLGSLAGRLVIILTIGMSVAAISSLAVAEHFRKTEFERFRAERIALSAADVLRRLDLAPRETRAQLAKEAIIGAHLFKGKSHAGEALDPTLVATLNRRLAPGREATGFQGRFEDCFGRFTPDLREKYSRRAAGFVSLLPECWVVRARSPEGGPFTVMTFDLPAIRMQRSAALNPVYLVLIVVAAALLSALVSRLALGSLGKLTAAAHAFSNDIDAEPIAEIGPTDVRETFVSRKSTMPNCASG